MNKFWNSARWKGQRVIIDDCILKRSDYWQLNLKQNDYWWMKCWKGRRALIDDWILKFGKTKGKDSDNWWFTTKLWSFARWKGRRAIIDDWILKQSNYWHMNLKWNDHWWMNINYEEVNQGVLQWRLTKYEIEWIWYEVKNIVIWNKAWEKDFN